MRATYSPEDNKLRIYPSGTRVDSILDEAEYAEFKSAGYKWASKQECFVAPRWTPEAEDWALELCDEIEDEDYSCEERSADRAERFSDYRDKRRGEAGDHADTFEAGPSAFGHQNRDRAERQARRHDRHRGHAVTQWGKAEYWQRRTAGVIAHALHRSSASVRRGRILRLEAELRAVKAAYTPTDDPPHITMMTAWDEETPTEHVWCGPKGRGGRWVKFSALGDLEAASERWVQHYENRLYYERQMLENEGGMLAEVEIEPGGFIGRHQIHRVTKSPVTGRVVSVMVWGPHRWKRDDNDRPVMGLQSVNIERAGVDAYRAPTPEEKAAFIESTKVRKAEEKAKRPAAPPLINPTDEDAERLQSIWNADAKAKYERHNRADRYQPQEVRRMTQDEYSQRSKGSYASCSTIEISEQLKERHQTAMGRDTAGRVTVFKVRKTSGRNEGFDMLRPDRVIVITDKPQKPIPWELVAEIRAEQPTIEGMLPRIDEIRQALSANWLPEKGTPEAKLIDDAVYLGWASVSSMTQFGFTDAGWAAWRGAGYGHASVTA